MRACVAVLGPGRSGTSIAMMLLQRLGMSLSPDLVPASEANPDGHFEDVRIRDTQQRLLRSLSPSPYLPRPADWRRSAEYPVALAALTELVRDEHGRTSGPWGFKDPRTCALWPMWQEVFAAVGVDCRPVFCVRRGEDVVRSMMTAYGLAQDAAEGIYVYRVLHSLQDVAEGWFFVQYRAWRDAPEGQLRALAEYCGLDDAATDYAGLVAATYRPELDRQSVGARLEVSGLVAELDDLLGDFSGTGYDQAAIDAWCESVERRFADLSFVFAGIERLRARPRASLPKAAWRTLRRQAVRRRK